MFAVSNRIHQHTLISKRGPDSFAFERRWAKTQGLTCEAIVLENRHLFTCSCTRGRVQATSRQEEKKKERRNKKEEGQQQRSSGVTNA